MADQSADTADSGKTVAQQPPAPHLTEEKRAPEVPTARQLLAEAQDRPNRRSSPLIAASAVVVHFLPLSESA